MPPPPPSVRSGGRTPLRALLYDSWFDRHSGAVMVWRLLSGGIAAGATIMSVGSRKQYSVSEVGAFFPSPLRSTRLDCGQLGFVICGLK